MIVVGIAFTFAGKRLSEWFLSVIIFVITFGGFFMFGYTVLINPESPTWLFYVIIVIAILLGLLITMAFSKVFKRNISQCLGVISGILIGMELALLFKTNNFYVKLLCSCLMAGLGFYLSNKEKVDLLIKCFCTAVFGAFLVIRGVGTIAPGYPNDLEAPNIENGIEELGNYSAAAYAYVGGFIFLTISGTLVQMYLFRDDADKDPSGDDDYMKQQDENRCCGIW